MCALQVLLLFLFIIVLAGVISTGHTCIEIVSQKPCCFGLAPLFNERINTLDGFVSYAFIWELFLSFQIPAKILLRRI